MIQLPPFADTLGGCKLAVLMICDLQVVIAQTTTSALLFTSASVTSGNTSTEYSSCSLEQSFVVQGDLLDADELTGTSGEHAPMGAVAAVQLNFYTAVIPICCKWEQHLFYYLVQLEQDGSELNWRLRLISQLKVVRLSSFQAAEALMSMITAKIPSARCAA